MGNANHFVSRNAYKIVKEKAKGIKNAKKRDTNVKVMSCVSKDTASHVLAGTMAVVKRVTHAQMEYADPIFTLNANTAMSVNIRKNACMVNVLDFVCLTKIAKLFPKCVTVKSVYSHQGVIKRMKENHVKARMYQEG